MSLRGFMLLVRRWLWVVLLGGVLGAVVGWLSAPGPRARPTTYQATHTLIAAPQVSSTGSVDIDQAAVLATSGAVPSRVAARLGIDRRVVRSEVTALPDDKVGVIAITARSPDRAQAVALADVTADELVVEVTIQQPAQPKGTPSPLRTLEAAVASPMATKGVQAPDSKRGRAVMLGVFGLLLGVGVAFVADRFDNRIRTKHGAEAALGVPVLAEVPPIAKADRGRLLTRSKPSSFLEAYRGLRTIVALWTPKTGDHHRGADDGHRVILVTSPTAGEGKTTTAAHLATMLAEIGRSVLVISADLHRPRLHLYFDRDRGPGLTEVLAGGPGALALDDLDLTTSYRGLRFLASGAPVDNAAPLLERAGGLLDAARDAFDFVLVDCPPLLMTSDTAGLARYADGVLLVVRAGRTPVEAATRSAELLERLEVPVIGAVLVASANAPTSYRYYRSHYYSDAEPAGWLNPFRRGSDGRGKRGASGVQPQAAPTPSEPLSEAPGAAALGEPAAAAREQPNLVKGTQMRTSGGESGPSALPLAAVEELPGRQGSRRGRHATTETTWNNSHDPGRG